MCPFDDPHYQIPANISVPKLGPTPLGDSKDIKIQELEERLFGLECAVIELCQALTKHAANSEMNFMAIQQSFTNLASYVMTPRTQILGEQQDKN